MSIPGLGDSGLEKSSIFRDVEGSGSVVSPVSARCFPGVLSNN